MRAAPLVLLGLAAYGIFATATIPARWVATRIASDSQGQVQLTDASGTVWAGTARAIVTPSRGTPITIEMLEWRFNPWRLLAAEASFATRVKAAGLAGDFEASRGLARWHLRQLALKGDASGLAHLLPVAGTLQPQGLLVVTAPLLTWDGTDLRGEATLEWQDAAISLSDVRPLGTYRTTLKATGGPGQVAVTTLQGPLRITANGTYTLPSTLVLTGEAKPEGPYAPRLDPLLQLIGPKRPDGAAAIAWHLR